MSPALVAVAINNAPDAAASPWPAMWFGVTMLVMLVGMPALFRSDVPFEKTLQHFVAWVVSILSISSVATFLIYWFSRGAG